MKQKLTLALLTLTLGASLFGQAPAAAPPATPAPAPAAAAPATPAPVPITDADLRGVEAPKADARAKGDPDGALTGTVSDISVADSKKGLTIGDLVNQVGQNKIAINFTWTLVCGFLV